MTRSKLNKYRRTASKKPKRCHSLKDLELPALRCHRLHRHSYDTDGIFAEDGIYREQLVCGNCGTIRTDDIDPDSLEVTKHDYSWQDGYLLSFDAGSADCRREEIARLLPRATT